MSLESLLIENQMDDAYAKQSACTCLQDCAKAFAQALKWCWKLTAVMGGAPWNIMFTWMYDSAAAGSPTELAYAICCGMSYPLNTGIILGSLHSTKVLRTSFSPLEALYVGWAVSMCVLMTLGGIVSRRAKIGGADPVDATLGFLALLLLPFGVETADHSRVKASRLFEWTYPLLSLLAGQACFFIAFWITRTNPTLVCMPITTACESMHFEQNGLCCTVESRTFDLVPFLSSVGGNVISGYAGVKCMATFIIWGASNIEHKQIARELEEKNQKQELALRIIELEAKNRGLEERVALLESD
jgi:hypothetical protein